MGKKHAKRMWLVCLLSIFLLTALSAAADKFKGLYDKAFSDPSQGTPMPEEWVKKQLKYEKESEGSDVTVVFDQDVYHTLLPIIQRFGREHKLKIAVKEGTCGIVAGMLSRKSVDIGGYCCPAGKEDRLPGIKFHTLGIVAKAILVNAENPIDAVSLEQARDIFRGKTVKWSALKDAKGKPGPDSNIRAIGRFHCKARPGHWYLLLPDEKMFSPMLSEVGSIPDMISKVGADREAIGWEVLSMVEHYKNLGKVKPLKINGYKPTDQAALISRKYPLYRTYNLTTWEGKGTANSKAQKLVAYLRKEIEKLDLKFGFVSSSKLKKAGWKFKGDELVGEP